MTDHAWPKPLKSCAYRGVIGALVEAIAPQTEADPAAVLAQMQTMFGNCIGRGPHFRVGADIHYLNLYTAIAGETAGSRKGMSKGQAQQPFHAVDPDWVKFCNASGLSSGEGLIWAIRDPISGEHLVRERGQPLRYETVIEDAGISDKRLMIVETEFASTLRVMAREGSTLSAVVRQAWDGQDLSTLTKNSRARASAPHISIVGHITPEELRRYFEATDAANGFGNRFLWMLSKRSKELPHGGHDVDTAALGRQLALVVAFARRTKELTFDGPAREAWTSVYSKLTAGRPGMLGAMIARGAPIVRRLACLYALGDETDMIGLPHLAAALELWRYSVESVTVLFGDQVGDPTADAILTHLRRVYPESVTRTEISVHLFNKNKPASHIDRALALLLKCQLVKSETSRTGEGRPVEHWWFSGDELNEISPVEAGVTSFNSFNSSPQASRRPQKGSRHEQL